MRAVAKSNSFSAGYYPVLIFIAGCVPPRAQMIKLIWATTPFPMPSCHTQVSIWQVETFSNYFAFVQAYLARLSHYAECQKRVLLLRPTLTQIHWFKLIVFNTKKLAYRVPEWWCHGLLLYSIVCDGSKQEILAPGFQQWVGAGHFY